MRLLLLWLSCAGGPPDEARCAALLADPSLPDTVAEAEAAEAQGRRWTNREVREVYLCRVGTIDEQAAAWQAAGLPLPERAARAFGVRHEARVVARAMMADPVEVRALEARDLEKYGHPDGPTFAELVERNREKGLEGDAIYRAILDSAQRTDSETNAAMGF